MQVPKARGAWYEIWSPPSPALVMSLLSVVSQCGYLIPDCVSAIPTLVYVLFSL